VEELSILNDLATHVGPPADPQEMVHKLSTGYAAVGPQQATGIPLPDGSSGRTKRMPT